MTTRRTLLAATMALMGATSLPALASADVVKIGVLAPLSGAAAADGQEYVNGVQLAVDELNAQGGVAGHTFEVVVGDVGDASADAVATATRRLLSDRDMGAILTGYASNSNFEIEMMAEQEMVYLLSANSAQTEAIIAEDPEFFRTVWSFTPSYDAYETGVLPVIERLESEGNLTLPNRKIAIVSSDNPYSRTIAEGLTASFEAGGWEITQNQLLPFGEINDWRGFLAQVRQDPPALLVNTDYLPGNAATFMSQFMENPTNSLVFIQYAPSVPEFLELTRGVSNGVVYNLLGGTLNTPTNPRAQEVVDRYLEAYGNEPGVYGIALYEQMMFYADALEAVGDPADRLAIGEWIGSANKQTAMGRIHFDQETHLAVQGDDGIPLQFFQIVEGERILFSPDEYATGSFMTPPWME
ncbi:ABC transporter substrate-binding protein [Pararhodobacter sp.]|uniref:ABC transporter substrate-binding protein n=1 Tax=Pararhodobacter sp. TaxID=2127056 RepID=UPI002FDCF274